MQVNFSIIPETFNEIKALLSAPRFQRYLVLALGEEQKALRLYRWNCQLSQSLYWPLQSAEICTRNAIATVLKERYGPEWHFNSKLFDVMGKDDQRRLKDVLDLLREGRKAVRPQQDAAHVDAVIAALSMGFWLSMLSNRYEVPHGWVTRLRTAFPHLPDGYVRQSVYGPLDRIRTLRNRVAHHEPILQLNLQRSYSELIAFIGWISPATQWWVQQSCTFNVCLASRPKI